MTGVPERWAAVWDWVKGSPAEVVRSIVIPPENVSHNEDIPNRFEPGNHYFAVLVNEMFLTQSRQWFNVYDPMAIVVTEFTYDGEHRVVPFVIGPSLIEKKMQSVPNGMAMTDTLVAGVHPYSGGKFVLQSYWRR